MGFKVDDDAYRLTFGEGTRLKGAHIVIGSLTIGELQLIEKPPAGITPEEMKDRARQQKELVADRLMDWDLEDRNGPLPLTVEGLDRISLLQWSDLLQAWFTAITTVPDAVGKASSDGESQQAMEVTIPTETLSPSPSS